MRISDWSSDVCSSDLYLLWLRGRSGSSRSLQETLILCTDTLCQFRDHCSPDVLGPFSLTFSFSRLARLTRVRQAQSSTTPRRMGNNGQPTISSPHNQIGRAHV